MEAAEHACAAMNKDVEVSGRDVAHTRRTLWKGVVKNSKVMLHAVVVTIKRSMRTPPTHAELRVPVSNCLQRFKFAEFSGPLFAKHLYPVSFSSPGASIYGMKKKEERTFERGPRLITRSSCFPWTRTAMTGILFEDTAKLKALYNDVHGWS